MSHRIFNFSAGPAMLPTEALEKSAAALLDYQGKGFGIAEVSHRGKEFDAVVDETIARCKKLVGVGDSHDVLFLQGGATALFTLIPAPLVVGGSLFFWRRIYPKYYRYWDSSSKQAGTLNRPCTDERRMYGSNSAAG